MGVKWSIGHNKTSQTKCLERYYKDHRNVFGSSGTFMFTLVSGVFKYMIANNHWGEEGKR